MTATRHERHFREFLIPAALLLVILVALFVFSSRSSPATDSADAFSDYRFPAMQEIALDVSKPAMWKLRAKREAALRKEVLIVTPDDWVKATLREGARSWPCKIRLKGDWTDHLKAGKWSFRVRMRDSLAYRRMEVFSLQNPGTRRFLHEWLFHKVLRDESVLSPRYDFVRLVFNGSELGVYAIEEHFTKEMVEAHHRREGPLLKFSEDGLWDARVVALRDPRYPFMDKPLYRMAHPEAFQSGKWMRSDSTRRILHIAHSLMWQYKHDLRPPAEIFDLDVVARQYALTDLFRGHHSLVWHNRRFFFNIDSRRLEPVVYDAFPGEGGGDYLSGPFTGYATNGNTFYNGGKEEILGTIYFRDPDFVRAYYRYLVAYTTDSYLDSLTARYEAPLARRAAFLRREYLFYQFDIGMLRENAAYIRASLEQPNRDNIVLEWQSGMDGQPVLCLQNYTRLALEITGWKSDTAAVEFPIPAYLYAYDKKNAPDHHYLKIPGGQIQLLLRVAGTANTFTKLVEPVSR